MSLSAPPRLIRKFRAIIRCFTYKTKSDRVFIASTSRMTAVSLFRLRRTGNTRTSDSGPYFVTSRHPSDTASPSLIRQNKTFFTPHLIIYITPEDDLLYIGTCVDGRHLMVQHPSEQPFRRDKGHDTSHPAQPSVSAWSLAWRRNKRQRNVGQNVSEQRKGRHP